MAIINVQVTYDGGDITNKVISYDRDKAICTGIGSLRLETTATFTPTLYKEIILYEEGRKVGTYLIHTFDRNTPQKTLTIGCQDASLKLQSYFIAESYLTEAPTYSGYWIKKFLDEATVDYSMDTNENGSLVSNNTSLGLSSAMDTIVPLLQQNGWYLYFDADNVCHVGKLTVDVGSKATFTSTSIISITATKHDRMFRNRAVVWGTGSTRTGDYVFYDEDRSGNYENEFGQNDVRTVVISNSNIKETSAAKRIANQAANEFEKVNYEVTVEVAGAQNVEVGDYVTINSEGVNKTGIVTTVGSSFSSSGLVTHIVIDERCPRIFAYYGYDGYVYVGTAGAGVWRKPLSYTHVWSNFSTGLTDLNIIDLSIMDDTFAAVGANGTLFVRYPGDEVWRAFQPSLQDNYPVGGGSASYPVTSGRAVSCAFNKITGEIVAGFTLTSVTPARSWIYEITPNGTSTRTQFIDTGGTVDYTLVDVDNTGSATIATALSSISGEVALWNSHAYRSTPNYYTRDNTLSGIAITPSGVDVSFSGIWRSDFDGVTHNGFPPRYEKAIFADGRYIYEGFDEVGAGTSIVEIRTDLTLDNPSAYYVNDTAIQLTMPVGNRSFATVVNVAYNNNVFTLHNLITDETTTYTLTTPLGGFFSAGVVSNNDAIPAYYALAQKYDVTGFDMYKWYVDSNVLQLVGQVTAPATAPDLGGTLLAAEAHYFPLAYSDGYLVSLSEIYYNGTSLGNISLPGVIFYDTNTGSMSMVVIPDAIDVTNDSFIPIGLTAVDGNAYLSVYGAGFNEIVFKISPITGSTITYIGSNFSDGFVSDQDHVYVVEDQGAEIQLVNCETGNVARNIVRAFDNVVVSRQISAEGNLLVYDKTDGDVHAYVINSGISTSGVLGDFTISTNILPYEGGTGTFEFDQDVSTCAIVFDSIYLDLVSTGYISPGPGFQQKRKSAVFTPISGRSLPNYSRYADEESFVFQSSVNNSYLITMETIHPYSVEASIKHPMAIFNTTTFSGAVISGTQTGINQGKVYVSPNGSINTYSEVLLNSLHSSVSDLRIYQTMRGEIDEEEYGRFVLVPQANTAFPEAAAYTELVRVDVTDLSTTTGVVYSSGLLSSGGTEVIAVFTGYANHVETTNLHDYPYIFVSTSTAPAAFYQKDGNYLGEIESDFVDRSTGLPAYPITVIKCDDAI